MPGELTSEELTALRVRAERLIGGDDVGAVIQACEQLLAAAPPESDEAVFARRHLAESMLERAPWQAALHLRHVVRLRPGDDVGHALLGLCHALLGNYQACVNSFRRALAIEPGNAYYEHNLGHILDLGLDRPEEAQEFLAAARTHAASHHEILASHAHCLARLGRLGEAREAVVQALKLEPDHGGHRSLRQWIEGGATPEGDPTGASPREVRAPTEEVDPVTGALRFGMAGSAAATEDIERAEALWLAFRAQASPRVRKPEVLAAAVDYALACTVDGHTLGSQRFAEHYGVSVSAMRARVRQIVSALDLEASDPRFANR